MFLFPGLRPLGSCGPKRCMGRPSSWPENDYDASLDWNGTISTRAKWRSCSSARRGTLQFCLTPPTLSETRCFTNQVASVRNAYSIKSVLPAHVAEMSYERLAIVNGQDAGGWHGSRACEGPWIAANANGLGKLCWSIAGRTRWGYLRSLRKRFIT